MASPDAVAAPIVSERLTTREPGGIVLLSCTACGIRWVNVPTPRRRLYCPACHGDVTRGTHAEAVAYVERVTAEAAEPRLGMSAQERRDLMMELRHLYSCRLGWDQDRAAQYLGMGVGLWRLEKSGPGLAAAVARLRQEVARNPRQMLPGEALRCLIRCHLGATVDGLARDLGVSPYLMHKACRGVGSKWTRDYGAMVVEMLADRGVDVGAVPNAAESSRGRGKGDYRG